MGMSGNESKSGLGGPVLPLLLIPGISRIKDQRVDFADNSTPPRGPPSAELLVAAVDLLHLDQSADFPIVIYTSNELDSASTVSPSLVGH